MALNGQLRDFSLPDVLQLILQQRKSGRLLLQNTAHKAEVGISRGNISYIEIDGRNVESILCEWLLNTGRLGTVEHQELLSVSASMDRSILETLVAKRFITPDERAEWVQIIAEDLMCDLFAWTDGQYEFNTEVQGLPHRGVGLNISTELVTMEGMRRLDEWPRLLARLPNPRTQIIRTRKALAEQDLGPEGLVFQILLHPEQKLTIEEIARLVPFGKFRLYDALTAFMEEGLLAADQSSLSIGPLSATPQELEAAHSSRGSNTAVLIASAAFAVVAAFIINWVAQSVYGSLVSPPTGGFADAEVRLESMKLHNSILRYRYQTGDWPPSLDKAASSLHLVKKEREFSLGAAYRYQVSADGYNLWFGRRNASKEDK